MISVRYTVMLSWILSGSTAAFAINEVLTYAEGLFHELAAACLVFRVVARRMMGGRASRSCHTHLEWKET